jgi:acetyl-CoA synthetase
LPHTRSGKIMRRLLKARELGQPVGDTSTLEVAP